MTSTQWVGGDWPDKPLDVAIVGGGISGLATAFFLSMLSPGSRIALFEQAPRLGGTMQSQMQDRFLFEAGPNGFLSSRQETLDLVKESGAESLLLPSEDAARIRYVFTDQLHRLPDSPPAFLRTKLLSLGDKLRVLGEVLIPPKKDQEDESLRSFGYRRLGVAFTDIFLDAMSAGINASTPDKLSINAAFPVVVNLEREYGGLFRGMIRKRKKQTGPGGVLMSFRGGVGAFVDHLVGRLAENQNLEHYVDAPVSALARTQNGYRLTVQLSDAEKTFAARTVILATPAYASADLLSPLDQGIAARLRSIAYTPIAVVGFGYEHSATP